ncbi:DNA topoisomerase, partial [uncultured Duncaniella sp.]|uniref:DNA topoisomerase n=1 Tax=uncultured Duncaniella sp. TaxID=2768039 RepID=UPI002676E82F
LCNSYDNMKVKFPKKTRYSVGISGKWDGKDAQLAPTEIWVKESDAQRVYEKFMKMNGKTVTAEVVEVNPKVEWRHELLNMATLQEFAIEELGFLPARTMAAADLLFEKGLISSPRTSVSSLPHHLKRHIERRFPEAKAFPFRPEEQIHLSFSATTSSVCMNSSAHIPKWHLTLPDVSRSASRQTSRASISSAPPNCPTTRNVFRVASSLQYRE